MKKFIVILLLSLTSCSLIQEARVNNAMSEGKKYFLDKNYRQALYICRKSLERYPQSGELKNFCRNLFIDIKSLAGELYTKGDYKNAGIIYRYLIEYKPKNLNIETEDIQVLKAECIKRLFERALYNYRKGYLEEAISIWNDLLEIDPANSEAKKSLSTASMQLRNIKEMHLK